MTDNHPDSGERGGRGRWYVEEAMGGAGVILEQDAGAGGGPGYIAHVELYEDAIEIVRWWNRRIKVCPDCERSGFSVVRQERSSCGNCGHHWEVSR